MPGQLKGDGGILRVKGVLYRAANAVHLRKRADAEQSDHGAENRKQHGEPFPVFPHALFNHVERAAQKVPVFFYFAVFNGKHTFRVFGGRTQNGGNPHPEQRARAAGQNCRGHAHDVAGPDGGRKRRTQRAETGKLAVAFVLLENGAERQSQFGELDAPAADGHQKAGRQNEDDGHRAPDYAVDFSENLFKCHKKPLCKNEWNAGRTGNEFLSFVPEI